MKVGLTWIVVEALAISPASANRYLYLIASLAVLHIEGAIAQNNHQQSPIRGVVPSDLWNWGQWTNGVCGEAMVLTNAAIEIKVSVVNTNAPIGIDSSIDALTAVRMKFNDSTLYFSPTNSFCGPVELRDPTGRSVALKRPDIGLNGEYPVSYRLDLARRSDRSLRNPTAEPPNSLLAWHEQLARFRVTDLFTMTRSGEYKFTVWPKIYKRQSTNDDICYRMDLPPVSVKFVWNGGSTQRQIESKKGGHE